MRQGRRARAAQTARHKLITKRYKRVGAIAYALLDVTLQYRFWRLAIPHYLKDIVCRSCLNDSRCDRKLHQVPLYRLRRCVPGGLLSRRSQLPRD
ncbi:hypothetical protein C9I56_19030 [Paraburkholderia caribensis]|nr:hypothetical protein C2L66_04515 [Paraburkholderia caribensis]PTB27276.1 hypothetical protein C9I56_19030 [Paraburkholderia caribensis]